MDKTDNSLFDDDGIRSIMRAEVAAYHGEDVVHNLFVAGTLIIIALVGAGIFRIGGFV